MKKKKSFDESLLIARVNVAISLGEVVRDFIYDYLTLKHNRIIANIDYSSDEPILTIKFCK